jgi:Tfp pilus assembly protein PilF
LAHRDGENLAVRRKLAQSARTRGDWEALRLWAREVLFLDFEDAEAHVWVGEAAAARQQTHRARVAFETALQFDERCVAARLGLARLELRLGRIPEAQAQVRAALQADPENPEAAALERELAQEQTPP